MSLELGNLAAPTRSAAPASQKPSAQVWLNIGYDVEVTNEAGETETRFVSLPVGIPADTMEMIKLQGRNADYLAFTKRRNELAGAIQAAGNKLAPGEETEVSGLKIQLRRVAEPVTNADVNADDSRYAPAPISFG